VYEYHYDHQQSGGSLGLAIWVSMRPLPALQVRLEAAFGSRIARTFSKTASKQGRGHHMEIRGWDERYRSGDRTAEDLDAAPAPLLVEAANKLAPGKALDLACATGRNAVWLAQRGWSVTAVDGSPVAIEMLQSRASERAVTVNTRVANLEKHEYPIEPSSWNLVAICYYLQRDLFQPAKQGVVPGGILISIVHITETGEAPTAHRLRPGELESYFQGWEILHRREGKPNDAAHQRSVAEIVARRPADS
jgi:tellurite methyltransferase